MMEGVLAVDGTHRRSRERKSLGVRHQIEVRCPNHVADHELRYHIPSWCDTCPEFYSTTGSIAKVELIQMEQQLVKIPEHPLKDRLAQEDFLVYSQATAFRVGVALQHGLALSVRDEGCPPSPRRTDHNWQNPISFLSSPSNPHPFWPCEK